MPRVRYQKRVKAGPAVAGIATPVNTVAPVITGDTAGETSTTSDGTWTSADAFTYQWYLDDVLLAGETTNSIETDEGWVGQTLSVVVCGGGGGGMTCISAAGVVLQEASAYTGPLDLVPGAVVGYSVRALSAAMLGQNIFRLKRDSDSAELDFAADPVTGAAPVASIMTWLDGANGTFVTWYDQSGNAKHLSMMYAEPAYASAQFGTAPAVAFDQSGAFQSSDTVTIAGGAATVFVVAKALPIGATHAIAGMNYDTQAGDFWGVRISSWNGTTSRIENNASSDSGSTTFGGCFTNASAEYDDTNAVIDCAYNNASADIRFNNAAQAVTDQTFGTVGTITDFLCVGAGEIDGGGLFLGNMGEFLLYASKLSDANRLAIRQNEATPFGITLS